MLRLVDEMFTQSFTAVISQLFVLNVFFFLIPIAKEKLFFQECFLALEFLLNS